MKNAIKRAAKALALILCLCLTAGAAPAKADALDMVNLLSPWIEGDEAQLSVSYEIKNLLPYNDSTLTLLNNVLKHITVEGRVSGNDTSMGISVDGDSLFTLEETQENGRSVLRTELLPNRELTSAQNALDALFPEDETAEPAEEGTDALPGGSFDLNAALTEAEACYRQLTDGIQPYAEEKKANYTIKNVGKGKWVRLAKLTAEQAETLKPQIAAVLSCGMDEAFRQQMESLILKKGFTVALYRTAEDGDDLAVYIKGNAAIEDVNYTIAYQWAFARGENGNDTDTYKLEFNRPKGKIDKRTAEASRTQSVSEDGRKLTVQSSLELKEGKLTLTTTRKYDLTGRDADGGTAVSGSIVDTVKQQDSKEKTSSTTSTELVPELKWAGGVLSGTINVARLNGKTPAGEYVRRYVLRPGAGTGRCQQQRRLRPHRADHHRRLQRAAEHGHTAGHAVRLLSGRRNARGRDGIHRPLHPDDRRSGHRRRGRAGGAAGRAVPTGGGQVASRAGGAAGRRLRAAFGFHVRRGLSGVFEPAGTVKLKPSKEADPWENGTDYSASGARWRCACACALARWPKACRATRWRKSWSSSWTRAAAFPARWKCRPTGPTRPFPSSGTTSTPGKTARPWSSSGWIFG